MLPRTVLLVLILPYTFPTEAAPVFAGFEGRGLSDVPDLNENFRKISGAVDNSDHLQRARSRGVDNEVIRIELHNPKRRGNEVKSFRICPASGASASRSQARKIAASTRSAAAGLSRAMKLQMSPKSSDAWGVNC